MSRPDAETDALAAGVPRAARADVPRAAGAGIPRGADADISPPTGADVAPPAAADVPHVARPVLDVRGLQSNAGQGPSSQINIFNAPPSSSPPRTGTRIAAETVGVFAFTVLAIGLYQQPTLVPAGTGWSVLRALAALLCLSTATTIAMLSGRRRDPRSGVLLAAGCAVVLVVVAGISTARWWPARGAPTCGAAQIAVDTQLRPRVEQALEDYQEQSAASEEGSGCAEALSVEDAGVELHELLLTSGTPIAGVVTADPATLEGLDGRWTNLGVDPVGRGRWHTIGLDRASVFLAASERPAASRSIELSDLLDLRVGRIAPLDPVALAVMTAAGQDWDPGFRVEKVDPEGRTCPGHVVVPSRWTRSCAAAKALAPVSILDDDGNPIGAPVLGVHLTAPDTDGGAAPTRSARDAADDFLAWLERYHVRLGLQNLSQPIEDVLAPIPRQSDLVDLDTDVRPLHVGIVLDASLSMGRAADRDRYGRAAPWRPAVEGLRSWSGTDDLGARDRLTVVVGQEVRARPRTVDTDGLGRLGRRWPGAVPRGETGLRDALRRVRQQQEGQAGGTRRRLVVVVTDGVNLFTERPIRASALDDVHVLVVRDGNGCVAVPTALRDRCRTAGTDAAAVAAELEALVDAARAR